ncbi:hypothetical protein CKN94_13765 [Carnobacterium maltaromaticum]|nr:hypothetical protein CKN94_13765 [Carnobacterium maltaromaticum]TFJ77164.1 hypothetical protein CKN97_13755 [Carnobacterium maltaromaticum]
MNTSKAVRILLNIVSSNSGIFLFFLLLIIFAFNTSMFKVIVGSILFVLLFSDFIIRIFYKV